MSGRSGHPGVILSIQYLRGVAALMVVYFHAGTQIGRVGGEPLPLSDAGRFGVDVFFVVSGIVMWVTTCNRPIGPGAFLARRLFRIVPLYWSLTAFVVIVAFCAPALQSSTALDPGHVAASFLFVPWPHPVSGGFAPVVIPGWTLNYEMMFYVVFAGALPLPRRLRAPAVAAILALLVAAGWGSGENGAFGFYSRPIVLEFGLGMLIGVLFVHPRVPSPPGSAAAAIAGAVLLVALDGAAGLPHLVLVGLPVSLFVGGVVLLERARRPPPMRPLLALGDASYSIYLTHILVLPALTLAWSRLGIGAAGPRAVAFTASTLLVSVLVGVVVHRLFERPLTSRVGTLFGGAPGQRQAVMPPST